MLPAKPQRQPLSNPSIAPFTRLLINLLNICEKHLEDAAAQAVRTASLFLIKNSTYTDAQKDLFSNALFEGLRQYLNENGNTPFLDELKLIVINPTINPTLKPISETICYSLKKYWQNQNCLVPLITSTPPDAGPCPFYPYFPNDMLFKTTDYLEEKDIANLRCVSRFFARSTLVKKENEERLIWPGMVCNIASFDERSIASVDGSRFTTMSKLIFITNALGQSLVWGTNATNVPLSLCQSALAEDTMHKPMATGEQFKRVIADNGSIFTQSVSGEWFAYGNNNRGQLGLGDNEKVRILTPLSLLNGEQIKTVMIHFYSTFIQSVSGQWFVCGDNDYGQLGLHTPTPLSLPNGKKIKTVITNNDSTFIQSVSEQWFACGRNGYGQLGLGYDNDVRTLTPLSLSNGEKIKTVIVNNCSTFIQSVSRQWFVCGDNDYGQLGLGHNTDVHTLTPLSLSNGEKIKTVIANNYSTFIQSVSRQWFVCGNNDYGQLGLGHNTDVYTPTQLSLLNGDMIKTIITNNDSSFIQSVSEQWFVCGRNGYGQLGLGHDNLVHTPAPLSLPNDEPIKTVITNEDSIFIQSVSGQWFVCGTNNRGQLGLGHNTDVHTPTPLSLPLSFCSFLTTAQTTLVDSLIDIVISQNPITLADFLGRLLFAYAEQSNADSSLVKETAFALLSQQPSTYSACVRLIRGSGLLEAAAKLPDSNDDSLNLLCLCKKLYDKDFSQRVEDILSQVKNTEAQNRSYSLG